MGNEETGRERERERERLGRKTVRQTKKDYMWREEEGARYSFIWNEMKIQNIKHILERKIYSTSSVKIFKVLKGK